ncbi:DUF4142 domain-containing protein [Schlesneria sp.]|uniref:DUF4142 domain-containing protein n=1 Tax=Schlesneria sp. TaxID=2762018 RepID=UPI002F03430D
MMRKWISVSACSAALCLCSVSGAQQTNNNAPPQTTPNRSDAATPHDQRSDWKSADHTLATCVAIANQEEIAIAKFAQEKARSSDVKEFAKMLVKDHQAFLEKLEKFAPEAARDGYLHEKHEPSTNDKTRAGADKTTGVEAKVGLAGGTVKASAGKVQQTAGTEETADRHHGVNFIQLHREIAAECVRNAKEMLTEKEGDKFDECFVGHQIAAHAAMKTKLTVFERHASSELKDVLAKGAETTQRHMKKAEELMKELAHADSSSKRDSSSSKKE